MAQSREIPSWAIILSVVVLMMGVYNLQRYVTKIDEAGYLTGEVMSSERVFTKWGLREYIIVRLKDGNTARVEAGRTGYSPEIEETVCLYVEHSGPKVFGELVRRDKCIPP
jgi:hypothetical protein